MCDALGVDNYDGVGALPHAGQKAARPGVANLAPQVLHASALSAAVGRGSPRPLDH